MNIYIELALYAFLVFTVACSAFFSGTENAFASASRVRLQNAADEGNKTAALAGRIADDFTQTLSTILVGNNLVNIAASSAATMIAVSHLGAERGETAAALIMTVIVLIFGEIIPKILATDHADQVVLRTARPIWVCSILFKPVVFVVTKLLSKIEGLWTPEETEPSVTDEELVEMVDTIEEEGVITESEGELIRSAIEFSDTTAHEILTPRVDVVGIDIDDPVEEILADEELMHHSRVPVYQDSLDNIIGILNTKHLLKAAIREKTPDIRKLMFEPIFVHMTMTTADLLEEFRTRHMHMAVVLDEYGGTMGIVTLEDVLEEIVGDIWDEKDVIETEYTQVNDTTWIVDGSMQIFDLFDLLDIPDRDFESEYTTIGGWATEMLDRFPQVGDSFRYKNLVVTVTETDDVRAEKLRVELLPEETEDESGKE